MADCTARRKRGAGICGASQPDGTALAGGGRQHAVMRAAELDVYEGFDDKLRKLVRNTRRSHSDKPEVVGQIMTRNVRVSSEHRLLVYLVPLFGSTGHHHIPIIGANERLAGMITQSDLVAALGRAVDPAH